MAQYDYEKILLGMFDGLRAQLLARPLNLGGVASSGGGSGGGTGYIGQLPQTRITYDTDEFASVLTPVSGVSLLDNLNHIRYRLQTLENSGTIGQITVKSNGITVGSGITVLNFIGGDISLASPGTVNVSFSGGSGGGNPQRYNETVSGTSHFSTTSVFKTGTLRVYYNGLRQDDNYFTEDVDGHGFTFVGFSANAGDEVFVDYELPTTSGTGGSGGHVIQDEGSSLPQRSNLNFVGAGVTVTDDAANDTTTVTITASGGTGGGVHVVWDDTAVTSGVAFGLTALSTQYAYVHARVELYRPLKITQIGWAVRTSGYYNMRLKPGRTMVSPSSGVMILNTKPFATSGITLHDLNPPLILFPGTYVFYFATSNGANAYWWSKSSSEYGNDLFYSDGTYYDSATSITNNVSPLIMTAYPGWFTE